MMISLIIRILVLVISVTIIGLLFILIFPNASQLSIGLNAGIWGKTFSDIAGDVYERHYEQG